MIYSTIYSNVPLNRKVIHLGFRNLTLDDRSNPVLSTYADTLGSRTGRFNAGYTERLIGREMKLNIVIVSALIPTINSLLKCIRAAGLILEDLVPSSFAQALGLFRNLAQPKEEDNILIDVGAALTKIALLSSNLVKDLTILPLGVQGITDDIAVKLKVSGNCAEQLKVQYGRAFREGRVLNQKIIVKDGLASKVIQAENLYEVIAAKADYLLQEIKKALLASNYEQEKVARIIIIGGGSILEGFLERAEKILKKPVKMGFLYAVNDTKIQAKSAIYATSIGLIHFGFKNRGNKCFYRGRKNRSFMRALNQARLLYSEYF